MKKDIDWWSILWAVLFWVDLAFMAYVAIFCDWKWYFRLPALVIGGWLDAVFAWAWGMCDWRRFGAR